MHREDHKEINSFCCGFGVFVCDSVSSDAGYLHRHIAPAAISMAG